MLDELIDGARDHFDLTVSEHQDEVLGLADALMEHPASEVWARSLVGGAPLEFRLAAFLAQSRRWLLKNRSPVRVGVVFAMWGEHRRLRPKSDANPTGEDSMATKLAQLEWASRGSSVDWRLYAVDDGCPHGSADIAREIASSHPSGDRVSVLHLADYLPATDGPLRGLASADDSRKAGSIILGAMRAIEDGMDAIVYTDADNSVHLGQIGLLLRPWLDDGLRVVLGDRKHPEAVLVKQADRWGVGIKVLRHMQRMAGEAVFSRGITDTQAAFKLYQSDVLKRIIQDPTVYDFSFDTDWILAVLKMGEPYVQVPFAFIDSAAESASIVQGPMTTWAALLFGLVRAVEHHGFCKGNAAAMIDVIKGEIRSHEDLELLIDLLPPELEAAGEGDYGSAEIMSPEAMRAWIRAVKAESQ